jgi:hypothetical protein
MARSFSDIYGELYERRFGKQTPQPSPAGPQDLAREIGKAAAAQPPTPPVKPVQAADDDGSDGREVTCPECGHTFVADWQTSPTTSSTTEDDPDNEGDAAKIPQWNNSLRSFAKALIHRKIWGAVPPAETN